MFKKGDKVREKTTGNKGIVEYVHMSSRDREIGGELVEENYVQIIEVKFDDGIKDCSEDEIESA